MFGLVKFMLLVLKTFNNLLDVEQNALRTVPNSYKYLVMIILSCFWALVFGLYIGEVYFIGYSMIGHVALITMAFVTYWIFNNLNSTKNLSMRQNYELLRDPLRTPKCYELTDDEREDAAIKLKFIKV